MTRWAEGFIAVDWGTTNRRAYLVEGAACSREFEDGRGILSVDRGEFEAAIGEIRARLGDRPMLLAGMIGSNRGWVEAPYISCPAGLDELAGGLVRIGDEVVIVPGVALTGQRFDVMRGEEVQLLGAVASGDIPSGCLVCHPGTHNKWVRIIDGRIDSFRTVMTGELFNLLRDKSILSEILRAPAITGEAFCNGVKRGLSGRGITSELFEARARYLLGDLSAEDGGSFVSGLLIGEDVRVGLGEGRVSNVIVMGRPELTGLYSVALAECGIGADEVDGEGAFIAGACSIVERIR
jgi:2-dehydro-3-deoxygalactonokinase